MAAERTIQFVDVNGLPLGTSSNPFMVQNTGGAGGGASQADKSTFTEGTTSVTPIAGEYNTAPTTPASGQAAAVQITQNRGLHINLRNAAGTEVGTVATPVVFRLEDGINTANIATVSAFHSADNQQPGGTAFGLLTGGVAQLLNAIGNLDRQRETSTDGLPAVGVATGSAQFAMGFATTCSSSVASPGVAIVTPALMSGTTMGVAWSIQQNSVLTVDTGGSQENVIVTAITPSTFTASFAKAHTSTPWNVAGFVYNQEKDASGELDTKGAGAAVAIAYEYNAGAPGNINYDRERNINAHGKQSAAISAGGTTSSTSITLASVTGLQPGAPIQLSGSGTLETVYATAAYVPGATVVPLQSGIQFGTQTTATWEAYAANGPGLNGFLPYGIGVEEEALYNPVDGLFYIERAFTQDNVAPQNVVMEGIGLLNASSSINRWRDAIAGSTVQGRASVAPGTGAMTSLSAAAAPGNGTAFNLGSAVNNISVQLNVSGTPSAVSVSFQGSLDGTNWNTIGSAITSSAATSLTAFAGTPVTQIRAVLNTLSGGSSPTVTALIAGY